MRLVHTISIERSSDGSLDDRGVPAQTWIAAATARAWVQPKSARELMQLSQAGPTVSTHSVYLDPNADITAADRIVFDGDAYQVDGIRDEAGIGHHFKVDAHLVEELSGFDDGYSVGFGT